MIGRRREIVVASLRTESRDGLHRAIADVDGIPLWFESSNAELFARPEAFGSLLLHITTSRAASGHRESRLSSSADNIRASSPNGRAGGDTHRSSPPSKRETLSTGPTHPRAPFASVAESIPSTVCTLGRTQTFW